MGHGLFLMDSEMKLARSNCRLGGVFFQNRLPKVPPAHIAYQRALCTFLKKSTLRRLRLRVTFTVSSLETSPGGAGADNPQQLFAHELVVLPMHDGLKRGVQT